MDEVEAMFRSPFPGMDPFLEDKGVWPHVHARMISEIQSLLSPVLWPNYIVQVSEWLYVTGPDDPGFPAMIPDVTVRAGTPTREIGTANRTMVAEPVRIGLLDPEIRNRYIEVRNRETKAIITAIEVLSPANKVRGARGFEKLAAKRRDALAAGTHWIEIDLLRGGNRLPAIAGRSDYAVGLWRTNHAEVDVWLFDLRQEGPSIWVPLVAPDPDVVLSVQAAIEQTYDRGFLQGLVNYDNRTPPPRLSDEDEAWVREQIRRWREAPDQAQTL